MLTQTTTTALLEGLHDSAADAVWREFDARYRPIIFAFARKLGMGPEDAADVAQETLTTFVEQYRAGKYDRSRGRLRSWIIGIARYRVADVNRGKARRREWRGESAIVGLPDDDDRLSEIWEDQCRRAILSRALQALRENTKTDPRTIRAYELVAMEQRPVAEVAKELGMTPQDVITAKHRCLKRIQRSRDELRRLYEMD